VVQPGLVLRLGKAVLYRPPGPGHQLGQRYQGGVAPQEGQLQLALGVACRDRRTSRRGPAEGTSISAQPYIRGPLNPSAQLSRCPAAAGTRAASRSACRGPAAVAIRLVAGDRQYVVDALFFQLGMQLAVATVDFIPGHP
jgi:hypothetical protein